MGSEITSSPSSTPKNSLRLKSVSFSPPESPSGHQETLSELTSRHAEGYPATSVTGELTESPVESSPAAKGESPTHPAPANANSSTLPLITELNNAFQKSSYNERSMFLPYNDLMRIITPSSVSSYCSTYAATVLGDQVEKVTKYVFGDQTLGHGHARHVFTVLVLIDEPALIPGVIEHDISDKDLPLAQCNEKGTNYQLARRRDYLITPIECLKKWKMTQRKAFNEWQYLVKPLVFNQLGKDQIILGPEFVAMKLVDMTVLPFTSYEEEKQIVSGFSKVVRVKIHPAHYNFKNEENEYFALKILDASYPGFTSHFRLEVKALLKIRAKNKAHLVDVLTTFRYEKKYHLLFRWAMGGNLSDFWKRSNSALGYSSICWLAQQCHGLADGLDGIHNAQLSVTEVDEVQPTRIHQTLSGQSGMWVSKKTATPTTDSEDCGRHGDIKPQNILWFRQDKNEFGLGTLKISDFGLTTFHTALNTKLDKESTDVTITYAPPEWELEENISRPFDIWSLGCVYLEFITWALLGSEGISEFKTKRTADKDSGEKFNSDNFYAELGDDENPHIVVKSSVTDWIARLKTEPRCTQYMIDFLDYIAKSMLVVHRRKRDGSRLVVIKLLEFFNKCRIDERYATSFAIPVHEMSSERGRLEEGPGQQGEDDTDRRQQPSSTSRFFSGLCCCK